jgi:hypothetical protein
VAVAETLPVVEHTLRVATCWTIRLIVSGTTTDKSHGKEKKEKIILVRPEAARFACVNLTVSVNAQVTTGGSHDDCSTININ